jgi:hypothetical protein
MSEMKFTKEELQLIDDVCHDAQHEYSMYKEKEKYQDEIRLFKEIAEKIKVLKDLKGE